MKRSRRPAPASQRRRSPGQGQGPGQAGRKPKGDELHRFWGDPGDVDAPVPPTRPTRDSGAVLRSLGPPPLVGQDRAAEAVFALVYDKAVGLATALAAANGLLVDEDGDDDGPARP